MMNRESQIKALESFDGEFDVIIIGGGASGLGVAVDSSNRGYKTLLIEKFDFGKGTSSRSTKLVHGGVRYLQNGDIKLVLEALRERGYLIRNAPQLVKKQAFVIPVYRIWQKYFYGIGLFLYDFLAGKLGFGKTQLLGKRETISYLPNLKTDHLKGGILYYDGQFDDAGLAISLAKTAIHQGAFLLNYHELTDFVKENEKIVGIRFRDVLTGQEKLVRGKAVVNATGVFSDQIIQIDQPDAQPSIRPSQGVHLVFDASFLKSSTALMVPKTTDGRVLFAVPWMNSLVVGTTDLPIEATEEEPKATNKEIDFILENAANYLAKTPNKEDVKSIFVGLRPLAASGNGKRKTKEVSRSHKITQTESGLFNLLGGKWTTYRQMAEDLVDQVGWSMERKKRPCQTKNLKLWGYSTDHLFGEEALSRYGSDLDKIKHASDDASGNTNLIEGLELSENQILWSIREEMAVTLEDVLARRSRCLFIDAKKSVLIAEKVTKIMAEEMGKDEDWMALQLSNFKSIAKNYQL